MLVQFGNNWIQKITRTAFSSNYFQIGQACSPITYTNHSKKHTKEGEQSSVVRCGLVTFVQ